MTRKKKFSGITRRRHALKKAAADAKAKELNTIQNELGNFNESTEVDEIANEDEEFNESSAEITKISKKSAESAGNKVSSDSEYQISIAYDVSKAKLSRKVRLIKESIKSAFPNIKFRYVIKPAKPHSKTFEIILIKSENEIPISSGMNMGSPVEHQMNIVEALRENMYS